MFFRHTQAYRINRFLLSFTADLLVGAQLRECFDEDTACIVEDFLYTREYWSLETCVLDDDYDGAWGFLTRYAWSVHANTPERLLRNAQTPVMLNLLLFQIGPTLWEVERSVIFYARHGRPELLQILLDKYPVTKNCAEKAIFEVRFRTRGDEEATDVHLCLFDNRYKHFTDFGDTGSLLIPREHEIATKGGVCLQILRRYIRVLLTGYDGSQLLNSKHKVSSS